MWEREREREADWKSTKYRQIICSSDLELGQLHGCDGIICSFVVGSLRKEKQSIYNKKENMNPYVYIWITMYDVMYYTLCFTIYKNREIHANSDLPICNKRPEGISRDKSAPNPSASDFLRYWGRWEWQPCRWCEDETSSSLSSRRIMSDPPRLHHEAKVQSNLWAMSVW